MEKMNDLRDLLKHEIMDLHSAESQIIKAMPAMIGKARNPELKQALQQHLKVTEGQVKRLEKVQQHMDGAAASNNKDEGLLSRLFKRSQVCRGMQGIIDEGERVMSEDMSPEVMDAAIIACAQKIEHYEICGYGTARAFAEELGLTEVATLLEQTLEEEYEADDMLTGLAVNRLNERAEKSSRRSMPNRSTTTGTATNTRSESSRQRAPREEMEMASSKRGTVANSGRGTNTDMSNTRSTDKGAAGKSNASAARVNKTASKAAMPRSNQPNTTGRGNTSSGRGGTTGRGGR